MTNDIAATVPVAPRTADGVALEAELRIPDNPVGAVVLAHPHPLMGGSMRSIVTSELFRLLPEAGIACLRFNFRGVEGSEGEHGGGRDERHDVIAAIDTLAAHVVDHGIPSDTAPLILCGWSFGADVALTVTDARLAGWFLIASPLRILPLDEMAARTDPRPKEFAIPENDEFRRPDAVREMTADWVNVTVRDVPGAGHYLVGSTASVARRLAAFVSSTSLP